MSEDKKPLTKIEYIQQELAKEDYHPSVKGVEAVLCGAAPDSYEDGLIDIIENLQDEFDALRSPVYPNGDAQG